MAATDRVRVVNAGATRSRREIFVAGDQSGRAHHQAAARIQLGCIESWFCDVALFEFDLEALKSTVR